MEAASLHQQSHNWLLELLTALYLIHPPCATFLHYLEGHLYFSRVASLPAIRQAQPKTGYISVWTLYWKLWNEKVYKHVYCADIIPINGLSPALQEHKTEGLRSKKEQELSEKDVLDLKTAPRAKDRAWWLSLDGLVRQQNVTCTAEN